MEAELNVLTVGENVFSSLYTLVARKHLSAQEQVHSDC